MMWPWKEADWQLKEVSPLIIKSFFYSKGLLMSIHLQKHSHVLDPLEDICPYILLLKSPCLEDSNLIFLHPDPLAMTMNEYGFVTQATPPIKAGKLPEILKIQPIRRNFFLWWLRANTKWGCKVVAIYYHMKLADHAVYLIIRVKYSENKEFPLRP